jgi:hypothetical protein
VSLLALLKRKVLTEQEFGKANEIAGWRKADLDAREEELTRLLTWAQRKHDPKSA